MESIGVVQNKLELFVLPTHTKIHTIIRWNSLKPIQNFIEPLTLLYRKTCNLLLGCDFWLQLLTMEKLIQSLTRTKEDCWYPMTWTILAPNGSTLVTLMLYILSTKGNGGWGRRFKLVWVCVFLSKK
jgi:hypothetical protein